MPWSRPPDAAPRCTSTTPSRRSLARSIWSSTAALSASPHCASSMTKIQGASSPQRERSSPSAAPTRLRAPSCRALVPKPGTDASTGNARTSAPASRGTAALARATGRRASMRAISSTSPSIATNGTWSRGWHAAASTWAPLALASAANRATRALLPTPDGPTTRTTEDGSASALASRASSRSRPTNEIRAASARAMPLGTGREIGLGSRSASQSAARSGGASGARSCTGAARALCFRATISCAVPAKGVSPVSAS